MPGGLPEFVAEERVERGRKLARGVVVAADQQPPEEGEVELASELVGRVAAGTSGPVTWDAVERIPSLLIEPPPMTRLDRVVSGAGDEMSGAPSRVQLLSGGQLLGRDREREALDRLLDGGRAGRGGVLVVHGEPGIGKTALLECAVATGREFRVAGICGVESEMELAFAALQQLCCPHLELMEHLPEPQRDALAVAFGLGAGPAPNPFLVGLAVLGLLAEVAEQQPLLCVVDDAQWLDSASARALAFVGRRLERGGGDICLACLRKRRSEQRTRFGAS